MPVEKEKPWHGLALECPVVLDATSPLYAMRCFSYKLRAHKPLFRGLSVVTRGELTQRFRLSQAYAYIIPRIFSEKLAKFQNKKVGRSHDQLSNLTLSAPHRSQYVQDRTDTQALWRGAGTPP